MCLFVVCCVLFAVCIAVVIVGWLFIVVCGSLFVVVCWLLVLRCCLLIAFAFVVFVCRFGVRCVLCVACCVLF